MAQGLFLFAAVVAVLSVTVAAFGSLDGHKASPVYIGYNYTLCRNWNGTLPVRGNCSAFYQCQNNYVWLNNCPSPLLYNANTSWCDYSYNVNCYRPAYRSAGPSAMEAVRPPVNQCTTLVNCFVDPCAFKSCPAVPGARCFSDYCGGCNARFFTYSSAGSFNEVTLSC